MTTIFSALSNVQFVFIVLGCAFLLFVLCLIVFSSTKRDANKRAEQLVEQMKKEFEKKQDLAKKQEIEQRAQAEAEKEKLAVLEAEKVKEQKAALEEDSVEKDSAIATEIQEKSVDFDESSTIETTKSVEAEIVDTESSDGGVTGGQDFAFERNTDDAEKQALKKQINDLKNDVENLKFELNQRGQSKGVSATGYNLDLRDLEMELYKAQQQYAQMGEKLMSITNENERLDVYLERITLLEKIMKLGSGIERLKNVAYMMEQTNNARNVQEKKISQSEGNRVVYSKIMEQVRCLNDRMDEMEKRRGNRERGNSSSKQNG